MTAQMTALADLNALTAHGVRFHGSDGTREAADWLEGRLRDAGCAVQRQPVSLPGWQPGHVAVRTLAPIDRVMPAWPMLWSGGAGRPLTGHVESLGPEGIWGDSITWTRFLAIDDGGRTLAYLHGRDVGPAAPQPLPSGADRSVPQLVVGHLDGLQIAEWLAEGKPVEVEVAASCGPATEAAIADNLIVDITGPAVGLGTVVVCAHYDSFFNTVGAYDNGSGTIALLQLAQKWATTGPPRTVRLIWFTAEEWHLGGSRHYVNTLSDAELDKIAYVVNLDGLGRGRFVETFGAPEAFGTALHRALLEYAGDRVDTTARFPPTTGTDDASFYRAGVPSLYMTVNDLHRLHQPDDLPNSGIADNIAWMTEFVNHVIRAMPDPVRETAPAVL